MKTFLSFSLTLALLLNPLATHGSELFRRPFLNLPPDEVRTLQTHYQPLPMNKKGMNFMKSFFYDRTGKSLMNTLEQVFQKYQMDLASSQALTFILYHNWAMLVLAKNGYMTASLKHHQQLFLSVLIFSNTYLKKSKLPTSEIETLIGKIFLDVTQVAGNEIGYLTSAESDRVRETLTKLPESFKSTYETKLALLKRDAKLSIGKATPSKLAAGIVGGASVDLAIIVHAMGPPPDFMLIEAANTLAGVGFLSIFLATGAAIASITPPLSAFTQNKRYHVGPVTSFLNGRCKNLLSTLNLEDK